MIDQPGPPRNPPAGAVFRAGVASTGTTARPHRVRLRDSLREVSWRLDSRDYVLARLLDEHRVLTTDQIAAILFRSPRTCRNRLDALRRLEFVDRFIPVRHGVRLPVHWVPGLLSARYVALSREEKPPTLKALRDIQDRVVASPQLAHTDGTNQFFVDLLAHARANSGTRLGRWWSARTAAAALGRRVHPDGHGIWRDGHREVGFLLEYDNDTESLPAVAAKLAPYRRLRADGGPDWPVLFWLPTPTREANLHKRLAAVMPLGVAVATANRHQAADAGPAGPVWKVAGNGRRRLPLSELPSRLGQAGPYHPGAPTPEQDPLYQLLDTTD